MCAELKKHFEKIEEHRQMYESKRTPGKKFGSEYVGKRYDSYSDGEQKEVDSTPKEHSGDKVNEANTGDVTKNVHAEKASVSTPESVVESHGPANHIHVDHSEGKHAVTSDHSDGFQHTMTHGSAKEAYDSASKLALEAGGEDQARDVKKMDHKPQQSAKSEEENWEEFDTI